MRNFSIYCIFYNDTLKWLKHMTNKNPVNKLTAKPKIFLSKILDTQISLPPLGTADHFHPLSNWVDIE